MKIRVLIVDDEPLARERVRSMLNGESDIEVIAEAANGREALETLRKQRPDAVFLDIQMPGMDGFELLRQLRKDELPTVVFVTAYDQHAIKAFELHALDYLLKPFKPSRFRETLTRLRERCARRNHEGLPAELLAFLEQNRAPREYLARVLVRTGEKVLVIKVSEIDYVEAAGNYLVVHAGKDSHIVRETMTSFSEKLDPKQFIRISRSALVKVDQIKELQPMFKGELAVVLRSGKQLHMTRGLREVQQILELA